MNLNGLNLQFSPLGDGLVIIAMVAYSFSVVMTKLFAQKEDPIILCGYQMGLGGIVLLSEKGGVATVNLVIALVLVCAGILLWGYEKTTKA